jgi:hypothetical protein
MATGIQLVFDTRDPEREARFWAEALGYILQPPPEGFASWDDALRSWGIPESAWQDASAIVDPDGVGPRIYFQKVPEDKTAKNRLHMDLNVSGGRSVPVEERKRRVDAEVVRLRGLGASDARGAIEKDEDYWVRMNDPEGNEFCVQ